MSSLTRVRDASVEAVLAGLLAGVVEGAWIASHGGLSTLPLAAAVATLGLIAAGLGLRGLIAIAERLGPVARWRDAVVAGGRERAIAAWRALALTGGVLAFGVVAFRAFALVHERHRFKEADAIGLVFVAGLVVAALVIALAVGALDRVVRPRLPGFVGDGKARWGLVTLAALIVALGPTAIVGRAVPAVSRELVALPSLLLACVLVARIVRLGRSRIAWGVAAATITGAVTGTVLLGGSPRTRGAIVEAGVASDQVARLVRRLADRDGDRFAGPAVGGADCDDADPRRHPRAIDVPGNGIDENCTGADAIATQQGLRTQARPVPPVMQRPNIVLISIDALRADHLGSYGYRRPTSPALDQLASSGTRFAQAYTSCPSTRCAIPSLLTGRYASTLGTGGEREAIASLPRVLRDAGYATAAITCCERFALARHELAGFATIDATADAVRMQRAGQSNADAVVDNALAWLGALDRTRPYFLWMHLYEPHDPYQAPAGPPLGDRDLDRYDREIAYLDAQLARLLATIDPGAIIVVTSDHGEEFGEHGIRFHARSLYNQVVRVPLIVRAPGTAARVVDTPVSIVDVMPTLLDLAGVAGPVGMNGRTLAPALRGGPAPARPVFVELLRDRQIRRDMAAVIQPPWKVIWDRDANAWSLYRLDDARDEINRVDDPALPELQHLLHETLDRETSALAR